jgi:hypothetical protein
MKKNLTLLAVILLGAQLHAMRIVDAIAANRISVEVSGADYNTMPASMRTAETQPKMQLTIRNKDNRPLDLDMEEGYMLRAENSNYQAMLLVQSVAMHLQPNEKQKNYIYAMCTQASRSGPGTTTRYHIADKAKGQLLDIAQFIAAHKYYTFGAQEAVWSISDDRSILAINCTNKTVENDLQSKVAALKGVKLDALKKEAARTVNFSPLNEFNGGKLDRNITFSTDSAVMVSVAFYTEDGTPIKDIVPPTLITRGDHSIRYNPYPTTLVNKRYTVKMLKNDELYREYYFAQ